MRIHSRLPVVIPQRVTGSLLEILNRTRLNTVVVIHANHAREFDQSVSEAIGKLKPVVQSVLNQAVLLRGINDSLNDQVELSEALIDAGVLPYYLHQLDPVSGAMHFEVPVEDGLELVRQMRNRLPGYMVPRYVRELAGEFSKTILA